MYEKKNTKRLKFLSLVISFLFLISQFVLIGNAANPSGDSGIELDCKSAVLMEAETGKILYAKNEDEALPPASVTKVMTLLLIMEAIDSGQIKNTDMVSASEHACSMGGSQIYLEPGEQMSVEDLLKSVVIASANDAAVALAEHVAGSEEAFVNLMNEKAEQLGMQNSHFENTNGLDDTTENHLTSAKDIAIMSRELIKHKKITQYSSIWMDSIRNGEFGLTNTNRLVRFYKGATGLKTGSTSKAGFCITATAEREGMTLIAVIMASPTRDIRNNCAVKLLNYGFANFTVYRSQISGLEAVKVLGGIQRRCSVEAKAFSCVVAKNRAKNIQFEIDIGQMIEAPITAGQSLGKVKYTLDGVELGNADIVVTQDVAKLGYWQIFVRIISTMIMK